MSTNPPMTMYEMCMLHARADRALRLVVGRELEQFKVTMMEWLLLGVVVSGPEKGLSMSSVAQALDVTLPQVTALVSNLLKQKLIKQKTQLQDRRSRHVSPTSRGKVLLGDMERAINQAMESWLKEVPDEELQVYLKTMKQLANQA
jgi:DNA-binding MarR family transcriptional regulator